MPQAVINADQSTLIDAPVESIAVVSGSVPTSFGPVIRTSPKIAREGDKVTADCGGLTVRSRYSDSAGINVDDNEKESFDAS